MKKRIQQLCSVFWDTYRLVRMNLPFSHEMNVLNASNSEVTHQISAAEVAVSLQKLILKLKGKYLSEDGKTVDYSLLKNDDLYKEFQYQAEQLAHAELHTLNQDQRKAFFINIYNTLTIHGLCNVDPLPKSLLDVTNFWKHTAYNINGMVFSLDDVEHGILRANTRHPSAVNKPFKEDDPRLPFSMKELDPRIHFVLNCGGKSCPAISVYSESNLETALNSAAVNFLAETVHIEGNNIHLSKLFQWYGSDFGSNDKDILRWIRHHLPDTPKETLTQLIELDRFKIVYDDYDWLINAK